MRGVPRHGVVLEGHSEAWKEEFAAVKSDLLKLHGTNLVDIQHIGSTAIAGIAAKPMLDIAMLLRVLDEMFFRLMEEKGLCPLRRGGPGEAFVYPTGRK